MGAGWNLDPLIRRLGGIASRGELLAAGWTPTDLWFADQWGALDRIRRGWYAAHDLPDDARAAWRAGGPLACVSALVHHGVIPSAEEDDALGLHISLAADGHLPAFDPELGPAPGLVVAHWNTSDRLSGTRLAVSPAVALCQALSCSGPVRQRLAEAGVVRSRAAGRRMR